MLVSDQLQIDEALRTCAVDDPGPDIDEAAVLRQFGGSTLAHVRELLDDVIGFGMDWSWSSLVAGGDAMGAWLRETRPWLSEESVKFLTRYFTWSWR